MKTYEILETRSPSEPPSFGIIDGDTTVLICTDESWTVRGGTQGRACLGRTVKTTMAEAMAGEVEGLDADQISTLTWYTVETDDSGEKVAIPFVPRGW